MGLRLMVQTTLAVCFITCKCVYPILQYILVTMRIINHMDICFDVIQPKMYAYFIGRSFTVHAPTSRLYLSCTFYPCRLDRFRLHHDESNDQIGAPATDVRQSQVFHGYPNYPNQPGIAAAMPPSLHDGLDHLGAHGTSNPTAVMAAAPKTEDEERNTALYGDLPESKRRKFILVDDPARGARVRVRVTLDQVEMKEMPDSYRKTNSVYPRSYFPMQMQSPPSTLRTNRFFDDEDVKGGDVDDGQATRGETLVPVPMLEGAEGEVAVPRISRAKKRREVTLNDLGYRMSWSQSRVFAGRTMFLQKSRASSVCFAIVKTFG